MKKLLLTIGKFIAGLVGLILLWIAGDWGWKKYQVYSWEPPTVIDGISLGMTKSDVLFKKGAANECEQINPEEESCRWEKEFESISLIIRFESSLVEGIDRIGEWYELETPFESVEDMKMILGDEDIMATSGDGLRRLYTYGDNNISFGFQQNSLELLSLGRVEWRSLDKNGEYFVRGKKVCPGVNCPFDSGTGDVKPSYQGKSYRDFLPSR
jgi:hypothetical protein